MATRAQRRAAAIATSLFRLRSDKVRTTYEEEASELSRPSSFTGMTFDEAHQYLGDHFEIFGTYRLMYPGEGALEEFDALADKIIAAVTKARRNRLLSGQEFYDTDRPAVIERVTGRPVPRYWNQHDELTFGEPPEGAEIAA